MTSLATSYRMARAAAPEATRIAVLRLGPDRTGVAVGSAAEPDATVVLGIGSRVTAQDHFRHSPPAPAELEAAIDVVEDAVMGAMKVLGGDAELYTGDASIRAIALAAGQGAGATIVLSVAQVEATFERLAAVSLGRPAAREGLPEGTAFAATLLIVRELMHHLGFPRITILAGGGSLGDFGEPI